MPETIPGGVEITSTAIAAAASGRMMEAETAEPEEEETEAERTYMVSVDMAEGIALRKGAGWEYGTLGEPIPDDTMLEISDRMESATGELWGYTEYEGRNGWVPLADTDRESFTIEDAYFLRIDSNGQIIDDFSAPSSSSGGGSAGRGEDGAEEADFSGTGSDGIPGEGGSDGTAGSDGTISSDGAAASDGTDSAGTADEEKKGGLPILPIAIAGGVVVLAAAGAGVGLVLRSRRRKKQAAAGDTEEAAEADGGKKGKKAKKAKKEKKKGGGFKLPFPKIGRKKKKEE